MRRLLLAPVLAVIATPALADDDPACRNGLFADAEDFALAEVTGSARAYFHGDMDGCPWTRGACASPAYVVPGDEVLVSKVRGGFACAYYPNRQGGTAGWVPMRQLMAKPTGPTPALADWLGAWTGPGGDNPLLRFWEELGRMSVVGEAFWPGREGTHDWPTIHVGELDGPVEQAGRRATYGDDNDCKVRFTLLADYLVASDNRQCGGANVSFSGVYTRAGD